MQIRKFSNHRPLNIAPQRQRSPEEKGLEAASESVDLTSSLFLTVGSIAAGSAVLSSVAATLNPGSLIPYLMGGLVGAGIGAAAGIGVSMGVTEACKALAPRRDKSLAALAKGALLAGVGVALGVAAGGLAGGAMAGGVVGAALTATAGAGFAEGLISRRA